MPAAIRFVRQIQQTGFTSGLLIAGYDPNQKHDSYQTGDVLAAIQMETVSTLEDYTRIRSGIGEGEGFKVILPRADADGKLAVVDKEVPPGQPRCI